MLSIEPVDWDLIILDEAQRIKNWEAKTSRTIKSLKSPFTLVLTGTPLENSPDGSAPEKKRQAQMHQFQKDPDCKVFIMTNAGASG